MAQLSLKQNPTNMYNLEYWVNNRLQETVCNNLPYSICKSKFLKLATTTHRMGKFAFKSVK